MRANREGGGSEGPFDKDEVAMYNIGFPSPRCVREQKRGPLQKFAAYGQALNPYERRPELLHLKHVCLEQWKSAAASCPLPIPAQTPNNGRSSLTKFMRKEKVPDIFKLTLMV